MILKIFNNNRFSTNNYLLIDEESKEAVLIDATDDVVDEIQPILQEYNATLKMILATHCHLDHLTGVKKVKDAIGTDFLTHEDEKLLLENIDLQEKFLGINNVKKFDVNNYTNEQTSLSIGKYPIKIISTPGHSKGCVCYLIDSMLFSGDTLFYEEIGRCDLFGGNFKEIEKSIKEKLFALDEQIMVYPGHGMATTIGHEKINNSYFGEKAIY